MRGGWVYMMSDGPNGTLYVGVTADLVRRVHQHRDGTGSDFVRRYRLHQLVWFERHEEIRSAIQREKLMKHWPRSWKARLIGRLNPSWADLYPGLLT